jgi:N-acetylglucosaminyldiphosphoundecaprenol N-acetyl-beta-D-mannosaminyltransferase
MEHEEGLVSVCGIPISNFEDSQKAIAAIESCSQKRMTDLPMQVNFINAHVINTAMAEPDLLTVLKDSDLNLADGVGIWLGGRILSGSDLTNLNGTDLGFEILRWGAAKGLSFFFLGAKNGIAEVAKEKLCARIPGLRIVGTQDGYLDSTGTSNAIRQITAAKTDILFVCMGVPNQEIWIHDNKPRLTGVKAAFGLGAFFDFFADSIKRAPLWMRKIRIEWIYRLYKEPRRLWKRYLLGNFIFFWHILKCRIHGDRL